MSKHRKKPTALTIILWRTYTNTLLYGVIILSCVLIVKGASQ